MQTPRLGAFAFTARVGDFRKLPQDGMKEPTEPDAFSLAVLPVASPHQRQAMCADRKAAVEGARAVFKKSGSLFGNARLEVGFLLSLGQNVAFEEWDHFLEDSHVAGSFGELNRYVREPQKIVRDSGAYAPARRRVPPVLDVTFDELPGCSAQQLLAS